MVTWQLDSLKGTSMVIALLTEYFSVAELPKLACSLVYRDVNTVCNLVMSSVI